MWTAPSSRRPASRGTSRACSRKATCSATCASGTWCSSIPTTVSRPCWTSSAAPARTPTSWPSSRPCTARATTRPSCAPSSRPGAAASRWWPWWSSRPASTRSATSPGPKSWKRKASTWSTASSASRCMPSSAWWCAARPGTSRAMSTSARATTMPPRPRSTRTWASSPPTRTSAPTSPTCSTS